MNRAVRAIERYGAGDIAFPWATLVLVISVGILGLLHDSRPKATQSFWIDVNAACGLLQWFALLTRLGWRVRHPPPPLPPEAARVFDGFPSLELSRHGPKFRLRHPDVRPGVIVTFNDRSVHHEQ